MTSLQNMNLCARSAWVVTAILASCAGKIEPPKPSAQEVEETADYPAVVQLTHPRFPGPCTGTFVSDTAILTAAHCFPKHTKDILVSNHDFLGRAEWVDSMTLPMPGENPHDLALLRLTTGTSNHSIRIGKSISKGDTVRLVGYGPLRSAHDHLKRTGTNLVTEVGLYIEIMFADPVTAIRGAINRAGGTAGDSGGPLLKLESGEYRLVGVIQSRETNGPITFNVNLTSGLNQDFIAETNSAHRLGIPD